MLEILTYGHPILSQPTRELTGVGDAELALIGEMIATMYEAEGVGLAAPQIGESLRLFVIDTDFDRDDRHPDRTRNPRVFINPKITWESDEDEPFEEGCLSVPDVKAEVWRPIAIKLSWRDEDWQEHEELFDDFEARVIQHEYDHLQARLFVDCVSAPRRVALAPKLALLRLMGNRPKPTTE